MEHTDEETLTNADEKHNCEKASNAARTSRGKFKMVVIVIITLFIQFWSLCSDTAINVFFGEISLSKGLSYSQIGTVFSSYDLARFMSSPVAGSLVCM